MLNRRILRIKAFKELFAIEMIPDKSLIKAQKELDAAMESTRDLYLFMLASIVPLTEISKERFAQLSKKVNKTEEEKKPNMKFAHNELATLMADDADFNRIIRKKDLSWGAYDLILRKIYTSIQQKGYFASYLSNSDHSLAEDCSLFCHIFEEEFVGREDLDTALEGINIYWNDDLAYALGCCCKTLEQMAKGKMWELPPLLLSDMCGNMEDDGAFVHKLMREAYANYDTYVQAISDNVPNWDRERFVSTDIAIIVTALAEIVHFPNIPVKVSINEYVEISKYFGTAKSSMFVNGILDTLSKKVEFQKR